MGHTSIENLPEFFLLIGVYWIELPFGWMLGRDTEGLEFKTVQDFIAFRFIHGNFTGGFTDVIHDLVAQDAAQPVANGGFPVVALQCFKAGQKGSCTASSAAARLRSRTKANWNR